MIAHSRADEANRRAEERAQSFADRQASSSAPPGRDQEGYWAYMQRQMSERTEKLNIMGDSMDKLEEHSSGWAEDVNKFVSRQKRNVVMGGE